jgi:carboxymethylenebutenolidase
MEIRVPVLDGTIDGYLAEPSTAGPHPGVVLIHDVFGLSKDTRDTTDRFAAEGYLALSPNMYSRGGMVRCVKGVFTQLFARTGRAFDDIESSRQLLASRPDCTGKIGIVGFCMGGGFALVAAARKFDASAPYYGPLPKDLSALDGACPVVASYGAKDKGLKGAIAKLETELSQRDIPHDLKEYPDASHAFANQFESAPLNLLVKVMGMSYNAEAAEDAWTRVTAFFDEHLKP